jgi:hypothetical protein
VRLDELWILVQEIVNAGVDELTGSPPVRVLRFEIGRKRRRSRNAGDRPDALSVEDV